MFSDSIRLLRPAAAAVLLGVVSIAAFAGPSTNSQAQILDTQRGISDNGSGGTELQTAPLSHRIATGAQPMATPDGMQANGAAQYPYIVAPYIQVPGGVPPIPTPNPPLRPRPTPH
ncbi:MAG: hypothetical protein JO067_02720 [Cupriavidus sp.]|nr:hypothetical protein [Cupriavidus sp.]